MTTICFANPKGGSGKTTACLILAEQLAKAGYKTAIVDCDPNENLLTWYRRRNQDNRKTSFTVLQGPEEDDLVDYVEQLENEHEIVLLDMEGTASQIVTFALSQSDFCIIPFEPTPMETRQASRAVKLVKRTSKMISRNIQFSLLMTRTNAAFQTSDEKDVRKSITNVPMLDTTLVRRAAYTRVFRDAETLDELMGSEVSNVPNAIANAKSLAKEIVALISKE